jgi:phenylacetate-CoA ligase
MAVVVEAEFGVSGAEREEATRALVRHVREMVGVAVTAEVRDPGTVERSAGKAQRVVDRRPRA